MPSRLRGLLVEADREAGEARLGLRAAGHRHDRARIDAAREEGAHRHVGDELALDRALELLAHGGDRVRVGEGGDLLVVGKVVPAPEVRSIAPSRLPKGVTRRKLADAA